MSIARFNAFASRLTATLAGLACSAGLAAGAEIAAEQMNFQGRSLTLIVIDGALAPGDDARFNALIQNAGYAVVLMNGDNGALRVGMEIGNAIHQAGFTTVVPADVRCASACALAWLGGVQRFMGAGESLAFHSAAELSHPRNASPTPMNQVVAAYLDRLQLAPTAIDFIEQPIPAGQNWLSLSEVQGLGIEVAEQRPGDNAMFTPPVQQQPIAPHAPEVVTQNFAGAGEWIQLFSSADPQVAIGRAQGFGSRLGNVAVFQSDNGFYAGALGPYPGGNARAERDRLKALGAIPADAFIVTGARYVGMICCGPIGTGTPVGPVSPSNPNLVELETLALDTAVSFFEVSGSLTSATITTLQQMYTPQVAYFGKVVPFSEVLRDKRAYVQRWPQRSYLIVPGTLSPVCRSDGYCEVEGLVDWQTFSPQRNARASGRASFRLGLMLENQPRVTLEESEVVARN